MKKRFALILCFLLVSCKAPEKVDYFAEDFDSFYAGFSSEIIEVPEDEKLFIAGYHQGSEIEGILDYQKASAITINNNIFISIDSVGISSAVTKQIRNKLSDVSDNVNVFSTHDHAGIDTLGLWGGIGVDGKNDKFMSNLVDAAVLAGKNSFANQQKSKLYFGFNDTEDLQEDSRDPIVFDKNVYQFRFERENGNGIRLINYAAHAESLRGSNYQVSADYVGKMRDVIKEKTNDDVLFVQGAIGGLIMTKELVDPFDPIQNMSFTGERLANYILNISNEVLVDTKMKLKRKSFSVDLDNTAFMLYQFLGILDKDLEKGKTETGYKIKTEASILEIGDILIYVIPGEIFPELVYGGYLKQDIQTLKELAGEHGYEKVLVFGLANDEIGYIIPKSDFVINEKAPYILPLQNVEGENHYEETNSASKNAAETIYNVFKELISYE